MSMTDLKNRLRALFGAHETTANVVSDEIGQVLRKQFVYAWPSGLKVAALNTNALAPYSAANRLEAQTGSLSQSQPLVNRPVFIADKSCAVKEIDFVLAQSITTSTSATTSWTLIVSKRGKGNSTLSSTWSVTTFVGGLCSMSTGQPGYTYSYSHIATTSNRQFAPNKLLLSRTPSKLQMKRGDVLLARVAKGASGVATSNGAAFLGGTLKIVVEEE